MPTRIIRDGILTSDRVNMLGWEAEVFYRRLMSVADDYGLYDARPVVLRSVLYPLKLDSMREASIERCLIEIEAARLARFYSVHGKVYLQIEDFGQQKKTKPKWPVPPWGCVDDRGNEYAPDESSRPVTSRNEPLPSVTKSEAKPKTKTDAKENVVGHATVDCRAALETPPPSSPGTEPRTEAWITNRVGTLDKKAFIAWLTNAHDVMPEWTAVKMNYAEQEAALNAYRCSQALTDREWALLRDYYAESPDRNRQGEKYWHPTGRKTFFDNLGDILIHARKWARENKWKPKKQKPVKTVEPETTPEDKAQSASIAYYTLQLIKADIDIDGMSEEQIIEQYNQLNKQHQQPTDNNESI